jgi:hypothetical protein
MGDKRTSWRAGRWERANASAILDWRRPSDSYSYWQLQSVCQAVDAVIRRYVTDSTSANAVAHALRPTRVACDAVTFRSIDEALAYLVQHLADRYGRVTQVLERLLAIGHLPIRKTRLTVLDIGAGPAPALYAIHDFYQDLRAWTESTGQDIRFTSISDPHALDRGPSWDAVLHMLSEQLAAVREPARMNGSLPFSRTHDDLAGFSVGEIHLEARESAIAHVMRDFDRADEPISRHGAQILATEESKRLWAPSAYDFIVLCNFLTNPVITDEFAGEITELGRSLTPGGLLIALGGTGDQYPEVWSRLDELLRADGLTKIDKVPIQMQANDDPQRRALIRAHAFDSMNHILRLCTGEVRDEVESSTKMLSRGSYIEKAFPNFQVQCWKNQARHRR